MDINDPELNRNKTNFVSPNTEETFTLPEKVIHVKEKPTSTKSVTDTRGGGLMKVWEDDEVTRREIVPKIKVKIHHRVNAYIEKAIDKKRGE